MDLQEFATRYRLRIKKDGCDDPVCPGKQLRGTGPTRVENGHHVFEESGRFYAYLNFPTKARWNGARRQLEAAGLTLKVSTEFDGIAQFDPEKESVVHLVLKLGRFRIRKQLSEEQRAKLRERLAKK